MNRPYVISIAGFDPSAGAGILADVKCFEQHRAYGFGVCSALTVQTDNDFLQNSWLGPDQIIRQLEPLLAKFNVSACKIGLIKDIDDLQEVIWFIKSKNPVIKIIIDPILKASAGYEFHDWRAGVEKLAAVLKQTALITPNYSEMLTMGNGKDAETTAKIWARYCPVLLKGGHNSNAIGTDYLFDSENISELRPSFSEIHPKHGSGCVLSAAITANIALGYSLYEACRNAKLYIEKFLNSNTTLLGYHSL